MRKSALLSGVAGLFLMTAPAFAQDGTAPQTPAQTPPAGEAGQSPAADGQTAAQPQQLTLQPGATVRGSDGAELGRLEGVRNGPSGQELTVRGSDGQLRGVSTSGIRQEGDAVVVDASSGQFQSSPAITDGAQTPAPTNSPDPTAPAQTDMPAPATEPTTDSGMNDTMNPTGAPAPGEATTGPGTANDTMTPPANPTPEPMADPASEANPSSAQPSEDTDAGDDTDDEPTGGDQPG